MLNKMSGGHLVLLPAQRRVRCEIPWLSLSLAEARIK